MLQGVPGFLVMLAIIALAVIAVMSAVLYGSRALGWGLHRYPKSAALITLMLVLVLFAGALSFDRLFPGCGFSWGIFGGVSRCSSAPAPVHVAAAVTAAPSEEAKKVEDDLWNAVKDSADPAVIQSYLTQYPTGIFAVVAKARIAALNKPSPPPVKTAIAPPKQAPVARAAPVKTAMTPPPVSVAKAAPAGKPQNAEAASKAGASPWKQPLNPENPYVQMSEGNAAYARKDYAQAMIWWQKPAAKGYADAQNAVGGLYQNGLGVPQDYGLAKKWFEKAASLGSIDAQVNLAYIYYAGQGVTQDYGQALKWFLAAGQQGSVTAQTNAGILYEKGQGTAQDYGRAMEWYREAAAKGYAGAEYSIGNLYYHGNGVPKDDAQALQWYQKAAAQGFVLAQQSIDQLKATQATHKP